MTRSDPVVLLSFARTPIAGFPGKLSFLTATQLGAAAVKGTVEMAGWETKDVDLFEVNEAFAPVAMIAMHGLGIPPDVLDIHGGACALGHPIGASGALVNGLQVNGLKRGLASICLGGDEATAMAVELVN